MGSLQLSQDSNPNPSEGKDGAELSALTVPKVSNEAGLEQKAVAISVERQTIVAEVPGGLVVASSLQVTVQVATVQTGVATTPQATAGGTLNRTVEGTVIRDQSVAPGPDLKVVQENTITKVVQDIQTRESVVRPEVRSNTVAEKIASVVESRSQLTSPTSTTAIPQSKGTSTTSGSSTTTLSEAQTLQAKQSGERTATSDPSSKPSQMRESGSTSYPREVAQTPTTPASGSTFQGHQSTTRSELQLVRTAQSNGSNPSSEFAPKLPSLREDGGAVRSDASSRSGTTNPASAHLKVNHESPREPNRPTMRQSHSDDRQKGSSPTSDPRAPGISVSTNVPEVRASVLERLASLRTTVERLPPPTTERSRSADPVVSRPGTGDFRRIPEKPAIDVTRNAPSRAERGEPVRPQAPKGPEASGSSPLPPGAAPKTLPGREQMSNPITEIPRAVDVLTRLVRATANADTLQGALKGVDTLCSTLAAIAAGGAIAADMITSHIISSLKDITTDLDEGHEHAHLAQEVHEILDKALSDLAAGTVVSDTNYHDSVMVADIAGIVLDRSTGKALAGVEIRGFELGKTYTNAAGVFVFKNVALGTSYRLVPTLPSWKFEPHEVRGACSTINFHQFTGRLIRKDQPKLDRLRSVAP